MSRQVHKLWKHAGDLGIGLLITLMYGLAGLAFVKSGMFAHGKLSLNSTDRAAVDTFLAAMATATVALVGSLLTARTSRRDQRRLTLDTVVSGLNLLSSASEPTGYAPRAVVAGALASLVELGHPAVALRTLAAAWEDKAVDPSTATWLINEVLTSDPKKYGTEAAALLETYSEQLCLVAPGVYFWPASLELSWPARLTFDSRCGLLRTLITMLLSKERKWWDPYHCFALYMLDSALDREREDSLQVCCARAITIIGKDFAAANEKLRFEFGWKPVQAVLTRASSVLLDNLETDRPQDIERLLDRLDEWAIAPMESTEGDLRPTKPVRAWRRLGMSRKA